MSDSPQQKGREVAVRLFAEEFNDSTHTFRESDEDRAPIYALLPTGGKANRVFVTGTVTDVEDIGDEREYWRVRIVDPTGTFFMYVGQYQPNVLSAIKDLEPPEFSAITGKPRTYERDDGGVNVSLRPENYASVERPVRERWIVETAELTVDRIQAFDPESDEYDKLATEQYPASGRDYLDTVVTALESLEED